MNIQKFYQALYNRGFRNTEAHEVIGKIAVETNGFKKSKYNGTFKVGRRKIDVSWLNDENGGKFSFNDMNESVVMPIKLTIQED